VNHVQAEGLARKMLVNSQMQTQRRQMKAISAGDRLNENFLMEENIFETYETFVFKEVMKLVLDRSPSGLSNESKWCPVKV